MSIAPTKAYNTQVPPSFDLWKSTCHDRCQRLGETICVPEHHAVEWKETPELLVIKAYLPGFEKKDVKIILRVGNVLCISGAKVVKKEENDDRWYHAERVRAKFSQRFKLPTNAITDSLNANMEDGLLTFTIPKRKMLNCRRIIHIS